MARDRELATVLRNLRTRPEGLKARFKRHPLEPVLVSAALAAGLHAALLSVSVRNEPSVPEAGGAQASQAMTVRMVSRLVDSGSLVLPSDKSVGVATANANAVHSGPRRELAPLSIDSIRSPSPNVSPEIRGLTLRLPGSLSDDDFFARSALDVAPFAAEPVLINYPASDVEGGVHASELTLYIDENGLVVRVRVDGHLPPAMEAAARTAFMNTRFVPGQVDGLAVRSRIRVEVLFEEAPPRAERAAKPN